MCAQTENPQWVKANRGANGIDGQLATALGFLEAQKDLWILLGDLTTLYDSNALWFWQKNPHPMKLVVINNQGGRIFERLFNNKAFYNEHNVPFAPWAEQWSLPYVRYQNEQSWATADSYLMEVAPDPAQTGLFWREYDQLWKN